MKRLLLIALLAVGITGGAVMYVRAAEPAKEKSEAPEVKVKLEDCPKAVQETIKKEVGAGRIEDIDKETEGGKTIYEVDAKIDGKDYEIKVAEDGSLISKKIEDEKNEKDEKDQKH